MMKTLFSILGLSLFMACSAQNENIKRIGQEKLLEMRYDDNIVMLDVRTPGEVAEGTVKGADLFIDYNRADFDKQIDALDKEKTYLVYCRSGNRSTKALNKMLEKGFKNLYEIEGGISAVSKENIR